MQAITNFLTSWNTGDSLNALRNSFIDLANSINEYNLNWVRSKSLDSEGVHQISESLTDMLIELGNREVDFESSSQKNDILNLFASISPPIESLYALSAATLSDCNCSTIDVLGNDIENVSDAFSQVDDAFSIPKPSFPNVSCSNQGLQRRAGENTLLSDPITIAPTISLLMVTHYGVDTLDSSPSNSPVLPTESSAVLVTTAATGVSESPSAVSQAPYESYIVSALVVTLTRGVTPTDANYGGSGSYLSSGTSTPLTAEPKDTRISNMQSASSSGYPQSTGLGNSTVQGTVAESTDILTYVLSNATTFVPEKQTITPVSVPTKQSNATFVIPVYTPTATMSPILPHNAAMRPTGGLTSALMAILLALTI